MTELEMRNSDTETPVNPFQDARVKSKFFGPTEAGQKFLDEHPELAKKSEGYVPVTFIPFQPTHPRSDEEGLRDRAAEGRRDDGD